MEAGFLTGLEINVENLTSQIETGALLYSDQYLHDINFPRLSTLCGKVVLAPLFGGVCCFEGGKSVLNCSLHVPSIFMFL